MTRTLTVEGEGSADDVVIPLTTQGSKSAPSRLVPAGLQLKKIVRIRAGFSVDSTAAGSCVVFLRLSGDGIIGGTQTLVLGAVGSQIGDDDQEIHSGRVALDVDIDVIINGQIDLELDFAGDDMGEHGGVVTLIYA